MPAVATTILPHPKSLNNITLNNLLRETNTTSVSKFLCQDLNGVSPAVANKIVTALDIVDCHPSSLSSSQVAALSQTIRDDKNIKPPSAACLSPAGEYNMRLGVLKELRPKLVATFTEKAGSCEGHPFIVEAAVSIGGAQLREGINVYRFANRIPLLFEIGADVVTQVATKRINWNSYHIDAKRDNIGVYVSVVSTKIPFKGTSKEYIGDDVTEIQLSVRKAIQGDIYIHLHTYN
jgi:DNA topoisomerase-6 subunit B